MSGYIRGGLFSLKDGIIIVIKIVLSAMSIAAFYTACLFFYGLQEPYPEKGDRNEKSLEYICPMHPHYASKSIGDCLICGMDLVKKNTAHRRGVRISKKQADEITLIKAKVSMEKIEKWVRAAGSIEPVSKRIQGKVYGKDANLIKPGQQVRVFPLMGRDPVLQGKVTGLVPEKGTAIVETDISDPWYQEADYYIMEIIVPLGAYPSIPNEAIIEENEESVVYVMGDAGKYFPATISTGLRGELYTGVIDGIELGDEVVTFGSFFLDAEYKLNDE